MAQGRRKTRLHAAAMHDLKKATVGLGVFASPRVRPRIALRRGIPAIAHLAPRLGTANKHATHQNHHTHTKPQHVVSFPPNNPSVIVSGVAQGQNNIKQTRHNQSLFL